VRTEALLSPLPDPVDVPAAAVRRAADPASVLVVLDDDPTGTQSVADLPVLTAWSPGDLAEAMATGAPAIYVLTNSRSLGPADAERINREIVASALVAGRDAGRTVTFVSRSDSTLRGHFPLEADVLADAIARGGGAVPELTLLVPTFPDAGRITVDSVHYWDVDGEATPVGETPFAKDSTFGFTSSSLLEWVAEKTKGRVPASQVASLTLATIRSGPDAVVWFLRDLPAGTSVAVDAACEEDMRVVALAAHALRERPILFRVGPPYVRAHIGQEIADPLRAEDVGHGGEGGGLVVVGSHVPLTTRQLKVLRERRPGTTTIELDVRELVGEGREDHIARSVRAAVDALATGTVIVHTSRELLTGHDGDESLDIARRISSGVVDLVRRVVDERRPRFVIAKGGITSSDVATKALGIRRATVRGPMLPGIVSLWEPETGPAVGVPYVVFAGNVGDDDSLAHVVDTLSADAGTTTGRTSEGVH
jgi:uncharacterized protein YgbK (DUF1537 family)